MTIFKDLDLIAAQLNKHKRVAERIFERSINQGMRAACDMDHDQSCGALEALERVRASVGSELAARLRAVEEDLVKLHAAHASHVHEENPVNGGGRTSMPVVLISGEPAEVLNTAEQDTRSWALIEKWYAAYESAAGVLNVEFLGPFDSGATTPAGQKVFFYARLPGGHMGRGTSRSDALAHAAEWCKGQL